ncbi:Olfactory Receptor 4Q2 [Manis pentadactyla]|nr:Olfactory Receptor 4Q2 [Manis pentadactyla]
MDENQTKVVKEFVLVGFSQTPSIEAGLFVLFLFFYVSTWVGNVLIMVTVIFDNSLHSLPMYFLFGNLSFLDLCYSTITTPKLLADFLDNEKLIPYDQCIVQLFFLHFVGAAEMFLLTVMAYDRYVAICRPLHYTTIMSRGLCCVLVAVSWVGGFVHSAVQTILTIRLPFCGPNQVDNFFCDVPPVIKLACTDTFVIELLMVSNSGLISTSSFVVLVSSYTTILVKIRSKEGRQKALSTCGSHLMVWQCGLPSTTMMISYLYIGEVIITTHAPIPTASKENTDLTPIQRTIHMTGYHAEPREVVPSGDLTERGGTAENQRGMPKDIHSVSLRAEAT